MRKFFSLIKASFTQGMNILNFKVKNSSSSVAKLLLPIALGALIMFSVGALFYSLAEPLHPLGETKVILTIAITFVSIITFIEGVYKSQDLLFNCRDNDLLFSLPIPKSKILTLRILKLLTFQFLYNLLFLLPAFVVYVIFEAPGPDFYALSILMLFLSPLLPTALAIVLGYFVRDFSSHFKFQKIIQTIFTFIIFFAAMALGFSIEYIMPAFSANAANIGATVSNFYYPCDAFISLIQSFNWGQFFGLLAISILPLVLIIFICSKRYFKIISKAKNSSLKKSDLTSANFKSHRPLIALTKKELNRYFSSPVYMFNTLVGLIVFVLTTGALCIGGPNMINSFIGGSEGIPLDSVAGILEFLPIFYMLIIIFTACSTSITSSVISLEGKSFNITKSLPVPTATILAGKALMSLVITIPPILIGTVFFAIFFPTSPLNILYILGFAITAPVFSALLGLAINLKYPKMNAITDAEVVKQSTSSMICVFIGMGAPVICSIIYGALALINLAPLAPPIILFLFLDLDFLLWKYLKTGGVKKFQNISA